MPCLSGAASVFLTFKGTVKVVCKVVVSTSGPSSDQWKFHVSVSPAAWSLVTGMMCAFHLSPRVHGVLCPSTCSCCHRIFSLYILSFPSLPTLAVFSSELGLTGNETDRSKLAEDVEGVGPACVILSEDACLLQVRWIP